MNPVNALWGNIFKSNHEDRRAVCELLKRIPLFAELRRSELREIERLVHRRCYQNGEAVFWESEPEVGMYIVQQGEVRIFKDYAKPGQKELARLLPGDFFGETALLKGDSRSATAVAAGETYLLGLIHPDLFDLFDRKPRLGVKLLSTLAGIMAQRLRKTDPNLQQPSMDPLTCESNPKVVP